LTQSSRSPSQVVPLLIAALVCDVAATDPSTRKHNLIGIFDRIFAGGFPTARPMSVYLKLTDAEGHYDLEINFVQVASGKLLAGAKGTLDVPDRLSSVDTSISFPPLALPAAGRYEFQIRANSVFLGSTFLDAVPAQKLQ
jgi:hypothetical protein